MVGQAQAAASSALNGAGLTLGTVTQAASATVASGEVVSEAPAAGTSVASGSAVSLVVSTGVALVSVPNVVGDTVAAATAALTGAGLTLSQTTASSSTVALGAIISQDPAAGQSAATGSAVSVVVSSGAASAMFTVLYSFGASPDGANPFGLIQGSDGNFYVTAHEGGANAVGAIIQIKPDGTETVLHSFAGYPTDGAVPLAAVMESIPGVFYGTTEFGGSANVGTVFQVTSSGGYTSLYGFLGKPASGADPRSPLIQVGTNYYGTTYTGGSSNMGTVFQFNPGGPAETDLHSFTGGNDGANASVMIQGTDGNFYGGTVLGGSGTCGTVFEFNTTSSAETLPHAFTGSPDGYSPVALVEDGQGNFYGVTRNGGLTGNGGPGTAFEINALGAESVLHDFAVSTASPSQPVPDSDGSVPTTLILGKDGNLYGTTQAGGNYGEGTVFRIALPSGAETVLYSFVGGSDGSSPSALIQGSDGNLYGVASNSGSSYNGTLFKITLP